MYREQHGEYDDLHTVGGIKAILKKKLIFQVSQNASHFVQPRPAFPLQWYFLTLHIPILSYLRKQEKPVLSKKPMTFLFNFKIRDEYHNIEYVTLWIFTQIVFSFRGWVFLILAADYFLSVLIGQTTQRLMLKVWEELQRALLFICETLLPWVSASYTEFCAMCLAAKSTSLTIGI